jgi:hypothetical protein
MHSTSETYTVDGNFHWLEYRSESREEERSTSSARYKPYLCATVYSASRQRAHLSVLLHKLLTNEYDSK